MLVAGDYKAALASKNRGTLTARETKDGVVFESEIADTQAGRDILEQAADTPVVARPIVDFERSDYVVTDGVAQIKNAYVRGILLGATDALEGWDAIDIIRENRSKHLWL